MSSELTSTTQLRNGYGIAAMVLGIVSVVSAFNGFFVLPLPIALSTGVLAVVFGVLGRRRVQRGEADNDRQALAGVILGPIGIVVATLAIAAFGFFGARGGFDDRHDGDGFGPWNRFDRYEESDAGTQ